MVDKRREELKRPDSHAANCTIFTQYLFLKMISDREQQVGDRGRRMFQSKLLLTLRKPEQSPRVCPVC